MRLLDWAAVAGRDIDLGLLTQSGAVDTETDAANVLEEARRAGVVDVADDGPDSPTTSIGRPFSTA